MLGRIRKALKIEPPVKVPAGLDLDSETTAWVGVDVSYNSPFDSVSVPA